jgi:hypothetical protein
LIHGTNPSHHLIFCKIFQVTCNCLFNSHHRGFAYGHSLAIIISNASISPNCKNQFVIVAFFQSHGKLMARTTDFVAEGVVERLLSLLPTLAGLKAGRLILSMSATGGQVASSDADSTAAKVDHSSLNDSTPALMCASAICKARGTAAAAADD